MSLAFAALLVSILTRGLAIIVVRSLLFDAVNRIPAENVIYLVHELTINLVVTSLQLLRYILRSVVAPVAVVQRLVAIGTHRPIWTISITEIYIVIIGSTVNLKLSRIMNGAIQTLCAQKRKTRSVLILIRVPFQDVDLRVALRGIAGHGILSAKTINVIGRILFFQE